MPTQPTRLRERKIQHDGSARIGLHPTNGGIVPFLIVGVKAPHHGGSATRRVSATADLRFDTADLRFDGSLTLPNAKFPRSCPSGANGVPFVVVAEKPVHVTLRFVERD